MTDGKTWLVEVALPVPLRQTFTYRVPSDLDPRAVKKGYRVLVPFRNRLIYGITKSDATPADGVDDRIRALTSFDGSERLLAPEIDQLLDWMVRYYRAGW
jgi:primosomal protein N' (replication factor Y) (superfamily II helicase)